MSKTRFVADETPHPRRWYERPWQTCPNGHVFRRRGRGLKCRICKVSLIHTFHGTHPIPPGVKWPCAACGFDINHPIHHPSHT